MNQFKNAFELHPYIVSDVTVSNQSAGGRRDATCPEMFIKPTTLTHQGSQWENDPGGSLKVFDVSALAGPIFSQRWS